MPTYSEMVRENNRKAYAKRFKTSPKNITDKDMENIHKEDGKKGLKRSVGFMGGATGASLGVKAYKSGEIDGVKKMSHITDAKNVDKIKREGLKGTKIDGDNLTMRALRAQVATGHVKPEDLKDKVYLANNANTELGIKQGRRMNGLGGETGKVKVNMPISHLKKVERDNPELLGAKNLKEFKAKHREMTGKLRQMGNPFAQDAPDAQLKAVWNGLSRKGTTTVQGTVGTKYIKGSKDYEKNTVKNVAKHIKENPKMFAKGVGKAGLAAGLIAGGGKLMYDGMKRTKLEDIKKQSKQEKKAYYSDYIYGQAIEKIASAKDDKRRDKDTSTKMWRDRVKPELKRDLRALPQSMAGAVAGGLAGAALTKGHALGTALGSAAGSSLASYKKKNDMSHAELERLSKRYLGKSPSKEYSKGLTRRNKVSVGTQIAGIVAPPVGALGIANKLSYTPEAMIQAARREKASKKN